MKIMNIILVLAILVSGTAIVQAQTFYFTPTGSSADWESPSWNTIGCGSEPTGGGPFECPDAAVICPGKDCTMTDDHEVEYVNVQSTGVLRLSSGTTLKLCGDGATSDIDGTLYVTGALKLDWDDPVDATHTFTGDGQINGTATGAEMPILGHDDNQHMPIVINSTTISGVLRIYESTDELVMLRLDSGTIDANGNGDLKIELGLMDDAGTSHFKVGDNSNARLYLDIPGACSGGIECIYPCFEYTDVEILKGRFKYLHNFTTEQPISVGDGGRFDIDSTVVGWFDAHSNACNE